jgi:HD-like signal output (HDOD) protein
MQASIDQWITRLGTKPLPAFGQTLRKAAQLLNSDNTRYPELADTVRPDVGFSIETLRAMGQHGIKRPDPITYIDHAIPLLGISTLARITDQLPNLEEGLSPPMQQGLRNCYSRTLHAVRYATAWARRRNDANLNEVATASLLHEIAEMALWAREEPAITEIYGLMAQGAERNDAAAQVLGISLDELGSELRRHWQLPEICGHEHSSHDACERRLLWVKQACAISHVTAQGWQHEKLTGLLEQLAEDLGTPADAVNAQLHSLAAEVAREIYHLGLPCPAFRLPLVPVPEKKPADSTTAKAATATPATRPIPRQATSPPPRPINPLQDALSQVMSDLHGSLGLQRVAFLMLSRDRNFLQARLVKEQEGGPSLRDLRLDSTQGNLFNLLLNKPQAIWMNADNLLKYGRLLPQQAVEKLGTQHFFAMSIFAKDKAIGLLYADGGPGENSLSSNSFKQFKALCQRANNALQLP